MVGKEDKPKISSEEILEVYKQIPEKPNLIKTKNNKTATVTLNDCLACSGCVTTAETILIQQQSVDEILNKIKEKDVFAIFTISPQSRASLAAHYQVDDLVMHSLLDRVLKLAGVKGLLDMSLGIDMAVLLSAEEFGRKFEEFEKNEKNENFLNIEKNHTNDKNEENKENNIKKKEIFPLICSECPGWVCYAEKVVGESIIPYMSRVKSPQQIMGKIIKDFLPNYLKIVCLQKINYMVYLNFIGEKTDLSRSHNALL